MDGLLNFVIQLLLSDNKVVVQAGPIFNSDLLLEEIRDRLYGLVQSGRLQYAAYREVLGHLYLWSEGDALTFTQPDSVIVKLNVSAQALETNYSLQN